MSEATEPTTEVKESVDIPTPAEPQPWKGEILQAYAVMPELKDPESKQAKSIAWSKQETTHSKASIRWKKVCTWSNAKKKRLVTLSIDAWDNVAHFLTCQKALRKFAARAKYGDPAIVKIRQMVDAGCGDLGPASFLRFCRISRVLEGCLDLDQWMTAAGGKRGFPQVLKALRGNHRALLTPSKLQEFLVMRAMGLSRTPLRGVHQS